MPNRVVFVYDDAALASKGATISGTPSADPAFPVTTNDAQKPHGARQRHVAARPSPWRR